MGNSEDKPHSGEKEQSASGGSHLVELGTQHSSRSWHDQKVWQAVDTKQSNPTHQNWIHTQGTLIS